MDQQQLANYIISDEARIQEAITTGAAWEIWMQVELGLVLRSRNMQVAREVPYPAPVAGWHADLGVRDTQGDYVVELKVESATNAGHGLLRAYTTDLVKIGYFGGVNIRFAVAVAYSAEAKNDLRNFAAQHSDRSLYVAGGVIGVLVTDVPVRQQATDLELVGGVTAQTVPVPAWLGG